MNSRQRIKEEFTYYLSNLVKSSRAIDGEYKLNKTSVNSYLSFLEVNKLFDYDENKSKVIKSDKTKCDALIKRNVIFSCKTKCNKISTFLRKSLFYMVQKRLKNLLF